MYLKLKNLSGQTLVETVAALAVSVIIIAALVGMAVTSLRSSNLSRSKSVSNQLLSEEIEKLRVFRDTNTFSQLLTDTGASGVVCPSVAGPFYISSLDGSITPGTESLPPLNTINFTRSFTACVTDTTNTMLEVNASVSWADSGGSRTIRATTYFSNWR